MKRLKRDDGDETVVDRLSSLPDSLIFAILSFLETREVVRTSLLSKEWKDRWTTIPYLYFKDSAETTNIFNLINGVLQRFKGTKILRFKISFQRTYKTHDSVCNNMATWISFAKEKKVEELDLQFLPYYYILELPQCLFSCSTITKLRLIGWSFQTEPVQWDRLKSLEICDHDIDEEFLHQLVSSAPQLQVLDVRYITCHRNLSIRSSSLKRLLLSADFEGDDDRSTFTLWAPNLERLKMNINGSRTRFLFDVPALTDVGFNNLYASRILELKQLVLSIQLVEALTLHLPDYKRLGLMKGECLFSNVKRLEIIGGPIRPNDIVDVAGFFPKVEKLITDWRVVYGGNNNLVTLLSHRDDHGRKNYLELRRVEVILNLSLSKIDFIYKLIKFLIKHAVMLQKIVICVEEHDLCDPLESDQQCLAMATEQLQGLQSSFPTIDIILC